MNGGTIGSWRAQRVLSSGAETEVGIIPNKCRYCMVRFAISWFDLGHTLLAFKSGFEFSPVHFGIKHATNSKLCTKKGKQVFPSLYLVSSTTHGTSPRPLCAWNLHGSNLVWFKRGFFSRPMKPFVVLKLELSSWPSLKIRRQRRVAIPNKNLEH